MDIDFNAPFRAKFKFKAPDGADGVCEHETTWLVRCVKYPVQEGMTGEQLVLDHVVEAPKISSGGKVLSLKQLMNVASIMRCMVDQLHELSLYPEAAKGN